MSAEERCSTPVHHHKASTPTHKSASSSSYQRDTRQEADSWEIIEGLRIGQSNVQRPDKHEGFMLKKRKWPLKGWHKRFFVLDNGMLKYSKSPIDIQKAKLHGCIDVGLSVMSIKKRARRIDLDTEEHIYHLKVKSPDIFDSWVVKLRHHRLYRQNEIVRSPRDATIRTFPPPATTESPIPHPHPQPAPTPIAGQHDVKVGLSSLAVTSLARCQSSLIELSKLLQSLEILQRTQSAPNFTDMQVTHTQTDRHTQTHTHIARSRESLILAQQCLSVGGGCYSNGWRCVSLGLMVRLSVISLSQLTSNKLVVFHCVFLQAGEQMGIPLTQQTSNESRLSMSESVSEFFDAQEVLLSASSSENEASDDESYVSDVSDNISEDNASVTDNVSRQMLNGDLAGSAFRNGRRPSLPAPSPDCSNINLWNILRNNIGKDLSKVSMPVELNEPLNTLQHMCEELEYTELLDRAADTEDPYERMAIMAAFVISGYSSTYYRAGSKPFNPLLGETYECIREDKGMCFIAEQVSHHPPISACHADSNKFTFWQDVRWKNKFWGKSMEILPIGTVNVMLPSFGDHYEWNKVTTCVHNILSGRRWIEHYGEITIRNTKSSACICKLTFVKGNYWSSNVNEVQGIVMDQEGKVVHRLFGKWHEGLYCGVPPSAKCIWRTGSMPTDYELYYGFTRFAIELNELCPEMQDLLPPTDARFRPDQRHLEEGNVEMAASEKQRIEDLQRTRRKWQEENDIKHEPRFFKERWVTNNTYWEIRKSPGFINMENPNLW
uniref:Oxysterol-binding protein n=1 Tax=Oncorhynchus kisutch TaxID=8019 RepID=A0A8C7HC55_ONCKI